MRVRHEIPWETIEVVCLDAGGTIVTFDFEWVARELAARGVSCTVDELERAEAAARPAVTREAEHRLASGGRAFGFADFLGIWFRHLPATVAIPADPSALVTSLAPVLRPPGESFRLWSVAMPGVLEALSELRALGVRIAVVSNSDGSAERSLRETGLLPLIDHVVDSAIVGVEKPDPAIFHRALESMRCRPERAVHVGDMFFADVVGARRAGLHAVLLDPNGHWGTVDCVRFGSVAELPRAFRAARKRRSGAGRALTIGLVGDRSPEVKAHRAIPVALELAASELELDLRYEWIATDSVVSADRVAGYDGLWCVPGSPYRSMDGALLAIRQARERGTPFLGTCGGFQHAVIEYARNVLGWSDAEHGESDPGAGRAVISLLACPLVDVAGPIRPIAGSRIAAAYGVERAIEEYRCSFGLNPEFRAALAVGPLAVSAVDDDGAVRAIELANHPFFVAMLCQPERAALRGSTPPLVSAFVTACADAARVRAFATA